jgi:hypothetical protein
MDYYFSRDNQQLGPHRLEDLLGLGLQLESLVWHEGMQTWRPAYTVPAVAALFASTAAPAPGISPVGFDLPETHPRMMSPAPLEPLRYQSSGTLEGPSGMAVASMVLGIVALVTMICDGFGLIPGVLAIIFGVLARKQVGGRKDAPGHGMATAGIICGSIAVGLVAIGILTIVLVIVFRS